LVSKKTHCYLGDRGEIVAENGWTPRRYFPFQIMYLFP